jgi:hypothetical protein
VRRPLLSVRALLTALAAAGAAAAGAAACGPRAAIPPHPPAPAAEVAATPIDSALAQSAAPTLYLQPDETFRLERIVAVVHPNRRIVGYHLLWRDDAHGAWLPFTIATDQEVVWVGLDEAGRPTDLWTYWHGKILHTPWRDRGRPEVDVQWGKHGSMPRHTLPEDLPFPRTHAAFYVLAWMLPDLWLGAIERDGPLCFCGGYRRFTTFSDPLPTANRLDVIVRTADPGDALGGAFGERYSEKPAWP